MRLPLWSVALLKHLLLRRFGERKPDLVINRQDKPYLRRWHVIPHNKRLNIYFHHFCSDDHDVPHDHPWWSLSLILDGGYREFLFAGWKHTPGLYLATATVHDRVAGDVTFRPASTAHRVETTNAWTIFITGPKVQDWGFYCPKGWRVWTQYIDTESEGEIGKGCGD